MDANTTNLSWPTRGIALQIATDLVSGCCGQSPADRLNQLLETAETLNAWLVGTTRIEFTIGPALNQVTGQPTGTDIGRNPMQIHDNEKFLLSVDTRDARGFETSDAVTWSEDQAGAVIELQVSADGRSCEIVAVAPGSAVVTVADAAAGLSATEAVDVVPGGTATIALVEGPVETQ